MTIEDEERFRREKIYRILEQTIADLRKQEPTGGIDQFAQLVVAAAYRAYAAGYIRACDVLDPRPAIREQDDAPDTSTTDWEALFKECDHR